MYTMMAVAVWLVWIKPSPLPDQQQNLQGKRGRFAIYLFFVHLIPNALWSWVFFAWRLGTLSVVNIILLLIFIAVLVWLFYRSNRLGCHLAGAVSLMGDLCHCLEHCDMVHESGNIVGFQPALYRIALILISV